MLAHTPLNRNPEARRASLQDVRITLWARSFAISDHNDFPTNTCYDYNHFLKERLYNYRLEHYKEISKTLDLSFKVCTCKL
jgi:hypothetical protein